MKGGQEDCRGGDLGFEAGVGQGGNRRAEIENLMQIAGEGGELVAGSILPSHKCKVTVPPNTALSTTVIVLTFPGSRLLALALFVALAPEQFSIDRGDLLQVIFHFLVVL